MRSEIYVMKGVEKNPEIVILNAENDESTTADNDLQFDIPLPGLPFLVRRTGKVELELASGKEYFSKNMFDIH